MPEPQPQWQVLPNVQPPEWFIQAVRSYVPDLSGHYAAQLLWQRGIQDEKQLPGFLNPALFKPSSPFEFGQEIGWAVERLVQARHTGEKVAIWGDFDADGITSTAVLWDGLGQFLLHNQQLTYYIPNRLTESHGLNCPGIDRLAQAGIQLIVTCDTGSTNLAEIKYAQQLGIDIIITDHHSLLPERPPVTAIINPRNLSPDHQLFNLSGVAVAYKLVEGLYQTLPDVPQQPLEDLWDLVAIGLIADLVQLSGDCRYLAQRGIDKLQEDLQKPPTLRRRPGVGRLLEFCKKSGDRPTDISFGLGPRINAVSRIQGDASFCVELLTSRDIKRVEKLAQETELANARRKSLQKDVAEQVAQKLSQTDLSTTSVIVLAEAGWPVGVLGLVAGQVAQQYGRPTILLSEELAVKSEEQEEDSAPLTPQPSPLARGSARSAHQIDLYQLVKDQAHLLDRFGGHPFAAGLSLPVENIPLFTEAINQRLRQQLGTEGRVLGTSTVTADLVVTVAELGKDLFRELKLLEPCGMGNPVPKLLIQNCWFERPWHRNIQDWQGKKVQYIKTEFQIWDDSTDTGFPGVWWGHYKEEIPPGRCDAIVELDFNTYENLSRGQKPHYEVRLMALRPCVTEFGQFGNPVSQMDWILDWREEVEEENGGNRGLFTESPSSLVLKECPSSWDDVQAWFRRAFQTKQKLAIAYPPPHLVSPIQVWEQLVGIAKYLSRTGKLATRTQVQEKLGIGDRALQVGLQTLAVVGFEVTNSHEGFRVSSCSQVESSIRDANISHAIEQFFAAVQEEQFRRQYFYEVPLTTLQAVAYQTASEFP